MKTGLPITVNNESSNCSLSIGALYGEIVSLTTFEILSFDINLINFFIDGNSSLTVKGKYHDTYVLFKRMCLRGVYECTMSYDFCIF